MALLFIPTQLPSSGISMYGSATVVSSTYVMALQGHGFWFKVQGTLGESQGDQLLDVTQALGMGLYFIFQGHTGRMEEVKRGLIRLGSEGCRLLDQVKLKALT